MTSSPTGYHTLRYVVPQLMHHIHVVRVACATIRDSRGHQTCQTPHSRCFFSVFSVLIVNIYITMAC